MVSITRHGRIAAYVMSPSVLDDYIEAHLALLAEKSGFASPEEVETFVQSL
jgi:hypothetical protein